MGDIPATHDQMVVGARVKCRFHFMNRFGKTGTVIRSDINYEIKWDDGADDDGGRWGNPDSFTIIHDVPDIPATPEQMIIGVRVKCIYDGGIKFGKTGVLVDIKPGSASPYIIQWDDGDTWGVIWTQSSSFTILPPTDTPAPPVVAEQQPAPTPGFDFSAYNGRPAKIKG